MENFNINLHRTQKSVNYSDISFTILFNFILTRQNATVHNFFLHRTISQRKSYRNNQWRSIGFFFFLSYNLCRISCIVVRCGDLLENQFAIQIPDYIEKNKTYHWSSGRGPACQTTSSAFLPAKTKIKIKFVDVLTSIWIKAHDYEFLLAVNNIIFCFSGGENVPIQDGSLNITTSPYKYLVLRLTPDS